MNDQELTQAARQLVESLKRLSIKVVLVESCTCGRAVAALGTISGVSQYLCGGWVVYRSETKSQWLGLDPAWLAQVSTESLACSQALATAGLRNCPGARLALSITGDLDPSAPTDKQGRVFVAAALRGGAMEDGGLVKTETIELQAASRPQRQVEAATHLLRFADLFCNRYPSAGPEA